MRAWLLQHCASAAYSCLSQEATYRTCFLKHASCPDTTHACLCSDRFQTCNCAHAWTLLNSRHCDQLYPNASCRASSNFHPRTNPHHHVQTPQTPASPDSPDSKPCANYTPVPYSTLLPDVNPNDVCEPSAYFNFGTTATLCVNDADLLLKPMGTMRDELSCRS